MASKRREWNVVEELPSTFQRVPGEGLAHLLWPVVADPLLTASAGQPHLPWRLAPNPRRLKVSTQCQAADGTIYAEASEPAAGLEALAIAVNHPIVHAARPHHICTCMVKKNKQEETAPAAGPADASHAGHHHAVKDPKLHSDQGVGFHIGRDQIRPESATHRNTHGTYHSYPNLHP